LVVVHDDAADGHIAKGLGGAGGLDGEGHVVFVSFHGENDAVRWGGVQFLESPWLSRYHAGGLSRVDVDRLV
jgi:hypothetical protein